MKSNRLLFVGGSAIIFNFALQFPYALGWLVFCMFVPLFYVIVCAQRYVRFFEGFFWGLFFYTYHFYAVCSLTVPPVSPLGMFLGYFLLVIYGALSAGCWFWLAHWCSQYRPNSNAWVLSCWILFTYGYFRWIACGMLLIMGVWKGYSLMSPLVPLAAYPQLLSYISIFGSKGLLFLLISAQALVALWLVTLNLWLLGMALFLFMPFCVGYIVSQTSMVRPDYLDTVCHLKPPNLSVQHPLDAAQEIYYALERVIEKNPRVRVIIAPESTYRFCLEGNQAAKTLWTDFLRSNDLLFIVGAYKSYGGNLINSLYLLNSREVARFYTKVCPMPIVEYLPFVSTLPGQGEGAFSGGDADPILLPGIGFFLPYICSDFFLDHSTSSKNYNQSILLVANDRWSTARMMGDLMRLYAAMVARETHISIIYISHFYALFLSSSGSVFPLITSDL